MKARLVAALAMTTLCVALVGVSAQSGRSPLEGAWELQNVTFAKPDPTNPVTKPIGMIIFSGTNYSIVYVTNSIRTPLPGDGTATADQLRDIWGPLVANAGTFQVSGNTLTTRAKVAKNPRAMAPGAFGEFTFAIKGDTLTVTAVKNDQGPVANPGTLQYVRAK
jgi:hypothetical protein